MEIPNPFIDQSPKPSFPAWSIVRLSLVQLLERFAFYGLRSFLILYLFSAYHLPENESQFAYTLLVSVSFFVALPAGFISDRWLKPSLGLILGISVCILGLLILFIPSKIAGISGILLVSVGSGIFKLNLWTRTSFVLAGFRHRLDAVYSLLFITINLGSFLAPLVFGKLVGGYDLSDFHAGIWAGILIYFLIFGLLYFEHKTLLINHINSFTENNTLNNDGRILLALTLLVLPVFWLIYDFLDLQIKNCLAATHSQFSFIGLLAVIIFTGPVLTTIWFFTRIRPAIKVGLGLSAIIAALFIAFQLSPGNYVAHSLLILSEVLVPVSGMTIIAIYSPAKFRGLFFGIYILSSALFSKLLHPLSQAIGNQYLTWIFIALAGIFYLGLIFIQTRLSKTERPF